MGRLFKGSSTGVCAKLRVWCQRLPFVGLQLFAHLRHGRSVGEKFFGGRTAQFEQAANDILNEVIRARGTGGNTHAKVSGRKPVGGLFHLLRVLIPVADQSVVRDFVGILDEVCGELCFTHFRQV